MRAADESSLPRLLRASLRGLPVAARVAVVLDVSAGGGCSCDGVVGGVL